MKVKNLDIPENYRRDFTDSGITELNPPQKQAARNGLLEGKDMVVASPTASGKTFIAELAILKQVVERKKGTAVYIVPLKALASEKYSDFKDRYSELDVRISVGDMDDDGENLETADIIIATSEKLDSLLRHNPSWIHKINLVVVDEIHLLTSENRGPTLEVTITRLRELLEFQMLGLSATISNSKQLAEWLNAQHIESNYRPVELEHGIEFRNNIEFVTEQEAQKITREEKDNIDTSSAFKTGKEIIEKDENLEEEKKKWDEVKEEYQLPKKHDSSVQNIVEDTLDKEKQCLVFCNSRKGAEKESDRSGKTVEQELTRKEKKKLKETSEKILNALGNPTSQCKRLAENIKKGAAFHHAGLISKQRKEVEKAFKQGHIKTISATPTLAAGVNLPAYRAVIRDLKRYTGQGMDYIPVLEYEQMTGRAGRPKYDDEGQAISLAKNKGMISEIKDRYILGEPENIQSKLAVEPVLRMHTLALIASKFCTSEEELFKFFDKTFYSHQYEGAESVQDKIKKVLKQLEDYEFLKENTFGATKLGERVSELYIDPDSAHLILECLKKAEEKNTKAISYLFMLSRTSELQPRLNVKDKEWSDIETAMFDAEEYLLESVPAEWDVEYDVFIESMKTSLMMQSWIDETDEQEIMDEFNIAPGGIRAKTKNADWLLYASKELARMKNIEIQDELEKTRIRLQHGIREELLKLVKYDQIGRVRARKLHDFGIETQEDIRETSFEKLKKLIGKKTAEKLKKQVGQENIFDRENIMDYFE